MYRVDGGSDLIVTFEWNAVHLEQIGPALRPVLNLEPVQRTRAGST